MASEETIEKTRQAIMRFRELLDILSEKLAHGERAYEELFSTYAEREDLTGLAEKAQQGIIAEAMGDDMTLLTRAALDMRFEMRQLERNFEQLHDNLVSDIDE